MADVKPLKLVDLGGGAGELREFAVGDTVPSENLDATLAALAALVTAGNKLIYATGLDVFATADLTAYARTLLDDPDALAARATLGVVKQTSATDTTAGALLAVGAWGNGTNSCPQVTDLDATTIAGNYAFSSAATGLPPGITFGTLDVLARTVNETTQIARSITTDAVATRRRISAVWQPWRIDYTSSTILGTVSQSSGVPTGAIIEQGTNANGYYVRYADGTQLVAMVPAVVSKTIDTAFFGGFRSAETVDTFPAAFIAVPTAFSVNSRSLTGFGAALFSATATTIGTVVTSITTQAASNRGVYIIAIGRWFT